MESNLTTGFTKKVKVQSEIGIKSVFILIGCLNFDCCRIWNLKLGEANLDILSTTSVSLSKLLTNTSKNKIPRNSSCYFWGGCDFDMYKI